MLYRKYLRFTVFLFLLTVCAALKASTFENGKRYRIMNVERGAGAVAVGSLHPELVGSDGRPFVVCYVEADSQLTDDCWWYVDSIADDQWAVRNAKTGQYLTYTGGKDWITYERVTLVDNVTSAKPWTLESNGAAFKFGYSEDGVMQYMRVDNRTAMVKADKYDDAFTLYYIYDEDGNLIHQSGENVIPDYGGSFDKYVDSLKLNGRNLTYVSGDETWMGVVPPSDERQIVLSCKAKVNGAALQIFDGQEAVTGGATLVPNKEYTLAVTQNGAPMVAARLRLTTLPILQVEHEGTLTKDMTDYVWGRISLTSADEPQSVDVTAKFKTRGATASTWEKHSFNVKLREPETEEEIDTTLLGLRSASSWILDAMAIDRIKMRNRVCFDTWNEFSRLPYYSQFDSRNGTVGRFVEVVSNGVYQGIYCLTDRINRKLLNLKKPEKNSDGSVNIRGVLYKSNMWDYTGLIATQKQDYINAYGDTRNSTMWCNWELTEPEDYPSVEAWAALDSLYMVDNADYDFIRRRFYLENMADWHLFILAYCLADNGNKNEFVSVRNVQKVGEDNARYCFTPWDMDTSLGGRYDGEEFYGGNFDNTLPGDLRVGKNYPFSSAWNMPDYRTLMADRWFAASRNAGPLSVEALSAKLYGYADLFLSSGAWEREHSHWKKYNQLVDDLKQEIGYILDWYDNRMSVIDNYLYAYSSKVVKGDVDFDGLVTADDVADIARKAVAHEEGREVSVVYDLDGDGKVTVNDIALAVKLMAKR